MLSGKHLPPNEDRIDQSTLALLFAADRCDHAQREINPAIEAGKIVVSDRFYHSSLAYQGSEADRAWIMEINRLALRPDLTIYLKVSPEVATKRRHDASRSEEIFDQLDFQQKVATGYEAAIAALNAFEKIVIVDGEQSKDIVQRKISEQVLDLLKAR